MVIELLPSLVLSGGTTILLMMRGLGVVCLIDKKSVNTGDNMEAISAFTRPVIFTLSLNFIFIKFIPLVFSNHLFLVKDD